MLRRLDSSLFTWDLWSAGSILSILNIRPRYNIITSPVNQNLLRKYADGWCYGYELNFRVKPDEIAVMFVVDEIQFWTHFRKNEFEEVFGR